MSVVLVIRDQKADFDEARVGVAQTRDALAGGELSLLVLALDLVGAAALAEAPLELAQRGGMGKLFGPGTATTDLIDYINEWFAQRQRQEA